MDKARALDYGTRRAVADASAICAGASGRHGTDPTVAFSIVQHAISLTAPCSGLAAVKGIPA
jgi:hypothetical protein